MTAILTIRPYHPAKDEQAVFALWNSLLGDTWPVSLQTFHNITLDIIAYQNGDHLIAEDEHTILGFLATQTKPEKRQAQPRGEIMLLLVEKTEQRTAIGTLLLAAGLAHLKRKGMRDAQLGGGGNAYFWPGVPTNLPGAVSFFEALGWHFTETSVDMVMNLKDYTTSAFVLERIQPLQLVFQIANQPDFSDLLRFEKANFPQWYGYFLSKYEQEQYGDVLYVKDHTNTIVGTVIVESGPIWQQLLGNNTGTLGAIGVAEEMRGQGIGLALAAKATEMLKTRNMTTAFLGWTWLIDWYGKLGYIVWREYQMSWKQL
jgi:beta-N-acetylhexosaminidase